MGCIVPASSKTNIYKYKVQLESTNEVIQICTYFTPYYQVAKVQKAMQSINISFLPYYKQYIALGNNM